MTASVDGEGIQSHPGRQSTPILMHDANLSFNSLPLTSPVSPSPPPITAASRPWLTSPIIWLEQYCRRQEGGIMPTLQLVHLSNEPPLYECTLEWRHLQGQALGKSKKEAEWFATINLCRVIESVDHPAMFSPLLAVTPSEWSTKPWFAQPKNYLYGHGHKRYGLEPTYLVCADGVNQFTATATLALPEPIVGKGTARTKRDATRMAALHLCSLLDEREAVDKQTTDPPRPASPAPVSPSSSPKRVNPPKVIPPPANAIKTRLHQYLREPARYETVMEGSLHVSRCTFGDGSLVGMGKANSNLASTRLAAQDLWIKLHSSQKRPASQIEQPVPKAAKNGNFAFNSHAQPAVDPSLGSEPSPVTATAAASLMSLSVDHPQENADYLTGDTPQTSFADSPPIISVEPPGAVPVTSVESVLETTVTPTTEMPPPPTSFQEILRSMLVKRKSESDPSPATTATPAAALAPSLAAPPESSAPSNPNLMEIPDTPVNPKEAAPFKPASPTRAPKMAPQQLSGPKGKGNMHLNT